MRLMRDSGIEWIGSIPANWRILRGKNIMTKLERATKEDDEVITCFRDGEVTLRSNRREDGFTVSMQEAGYQGVEIGDLVVHGMDGFAGSIGISDSRGKATPVLNILDSDEDKKYLMYFMRSAAYCGLFLSLATGIRIRTCDTNWNKLKNVLYLVPTREEQKKISDYVENNCLLVDNIIEKTKSSIEEYKKLKQSIITQAVTKGVRGNRPMKDSGIQWIGYIPEEWSVNRIGSLYEERKEQGNDTLPILTVSINSGVSDRELSDEENDRIFVRSEDKSKYSRVYPDDLTYNMMRAWQGAFGAVRVDGMVSPAYVIAKPKIETDSRYIEALLRTEAAKQEMKRYSYGIADFRLRLYWGYFKCIKVCLPTLEEQKEIADYIDEKGKEIDELVKKKEILLEELERYKKSLIYEYVTGKKEVVLS